MKKFALLGEKLDYSYSPFIHNEILSRIKIKGQYKLLEVKRDNFEKFILDIKKDDIDGFNVTIPYKQDIIKYLDYISDEAKEIGAINTVIKKEDKLYGYNTDYFGFIKTLENNKVKCENSIAVILGIGGACRAVISSLLYKNIKKIYLVSRDTKKESYFKNEKIKVVSYDEIQNIDGNIIINSTPVGTSPNYDESPVSEEVVKKFEVAIDLIYNPKETKFLKLAKKYDNQAINGLEMLIYQAIKAEELFLNLNIDNNISLEVCKATSKEFL